MSEPHDYHIEGLRCPACRAHADGQLDLSPEPQDRVPPKEGDWSICGYCLSINIFVTDEAGRLGIRAATAADYDELDEEMRTYLSEAFIRMTLHPQVPLPPYPRPDQPTRHEN